MRGLGEHYRDVSWHFVAEALCTLAIDLYSREGVPEFPDMAAVFRWMRQLPDPRMLDDLGGALAILGQPWEAAGHTSA